MGRDGARRATAVYVDTVLSTSFRFIYLPYIMIINDLTFAADHCMTL